MAETATGMSRHSSLGELLSYWLSKARTQESGILNDSDPEYLHHYRVALRRSRAIASQLNRVQSQDALKQAKIQLSQLMLPTGRLRDLDVFLDTKVSYCQLVDSNCQHQLQQLYFQQQIERNKHQQRLINWLHSNDYQMQVARLENFYQQLGELNQQHTMLASQLDEAIDFSQQQLNKRLNSLHSNSKDRQLHRLRISFKKLRYLVESQQQLAQQPEANSQLKRLKGIQTCLGEFNDLSVQIALLTELPETANQAIAQLVARLKQKQARSKTACFASLKANHKPHSPQDTTGH